MLKSVVFFAGVLWGLEELEEEEEKEESVENCLLLESFGVDVFEIFEVLLLSSLSRFIRARTLLLLVLLSVLLLVLRAFLSESLEDIFFFENVGTVYSRLQAN